MELRRIIKCSNCNTETTIYLSSQLALSELLIHGKCERCGNSLQITYHLIGTDSIPAKESTEESTAQVNLDMFNSELSGEDNSSKTIQDLIES